MKTYKATLGRASVVLVLATALNVQAFWDHWNSGTGGKPSRNGLTWERGPTNATLLWEGGMYSVNGISPLMEGDRVVMTRLNPVTWNTPDVQKGGVIVAHDLTTGEILWTNSLPVDFPETDWFSSAFAMREKRVYATRSGNANASFLYALDAHTGAVSWRSQDTISTSVVESPSFAPNGDLIVGSFYSIMRINATNGVRVWKTPRNTPTSGGGEPSVYRNRVYAWEQSDGGPKVSAYDLDTGAYRYSSPGLGGAVQQIGLFVGPDGTVYAPRSRINGGETTHLVAFCDKGTALVEKWRVPLGHVPFASFGVGPDGSVYSYSPDYRVIRIRPQDGVVINSSEVLPSDSFKPRMAIDSTGILFVGNGGYDAGALFSLNPDLTMRWTESIPYLNIGGPAIGKDGIMVIAGSGTDVRAYRGNSYGLPGPPLEISKDGNSLVITYSGTLESVDDLTGAWMDVQGAASPWIVPQGKEHEFYRSKH